MDPNPKPNPKPNPDGRTHILASKPNELECEPPWLQSYVRGTEMMIVGFIFHPCDIGQTFGDVALRAYRECGNVLLGCQVTLTLILTLTPTLIGCQDDLGVVRTFPFEYIVKEGDVGFCVTDFKEKVSYHARLIDDSIKDPSEKFLKESSGNITLTLITELDKFLKPCTPA